MKKQESLSAWESGCGAEGGVSLRQGYTGCLTVCLAFVLLSMSMLGGCAKRDIEEGRDDMSGLEWQSVSSVDQEEAAEPVVFEGKDMEGNAVSSDIFGNAKITMVNVWATYCNPCLREMPELGELANEYEEGDFQLIGIISDVQEGAAQEDLDAAAKLIEQTKADYSHLLLNESLYLALLMEVRAVPTTFFIDEDGVVLDVVIGARDKTAWKEKIDGFLEEEQQE